MAGVCLAQAGQLEHAAGGIAAVGTVGVLLFAGLELARSSITRAQQLYYDASRAVLDDVYPHELAERLVSSAIRSEQRRRSVPQQRHESRLSETGLSRPSTFSRTGALAAAVDNCTVLFTDVVGFTVCSSAAETRTDTLTLPVTPPQEWSSNVPPDTVFQYLGTLFREFDRQAAKHKVYKVRTWSDDRCLRSRPTSDDRCMRSCPASDNRCLRSRLFVIHTHTIQGRDNRRLVHGGVRPPGGDGGTRHADGGFCPRKCVVLRQPGAGTRAYD